MSTRGGALWVVAGACALTLSAACDIGPKFDFDFGSECTALNCPCRQDKDCPSPVCRRGVCLSGGTCSSVAEPDGPATKNTTGDCAQIACSDGNPIYTLDPADARRSTECRKFFCKAGSSPQDAPENDFVRTPDGTPCSTYSDGSGRCDNGECQRPEEDAGSDAALDAPDDGG